MRLMENLKKDYNELKDKYESKKNNDNAKE
jgi:hypothetical protein